MPQPDAKLHEIAVFGGGCFWCTEAVFSELRGVLAVMPGYAGGTTPNPTYEQVCSGSTGHAEVVKITFDPAIVSYSRIIDLFWQAHDPTTLNRQGADVGEQYRSVIFYHDENQKKSALKVKDAIEKSNMYKDPIVTEILPFKNFYKAEDYHQNFYENNRTYGYCQIVIDPKIQKLYKLFPEKIKHE